MMVRWEIEKLMEDVERRTRRAMDPGLFVALSEKLAEYVQNKLAERGKS